MATSLYGTWQYRQWLNYCEKGVGAIVVSVLGNLVKTL